VGRLWPRLPPFSLRGVSFPLLERSSIKPAGETRPAHCNRAFCSLYLPGAIVRELALREHYRAPGISYNNCRWRSGRTWPIGDVILSVLGQALLPPLRSSLSSDWSIQPFRAHPCSSRPPTLVSDCRGNILCSRILNRRNEIFRRACARVAQSAMAFVAAGGNDSKHCTVVRALRMALTFGTTLLF
jgi:hypothetical protein